jgi:Sigma-70, region 4
LPRRWAQALRLRVVEEYTAEETAEIMGCRVERVHRLVQLGKNRMRKLIPGYTMTKAAIRKVRKRKSTPVRTKHALHFQGSRRPVRRLGVTGPPRARVGGFSGAAESGA